MQKKENPLAQCIVCEKNGHWAAALRWHRNSRVFPLRETRSLIDARAALLDAPASVLVLETTAANAEGVLRVTMEARRGYPDSRVVVLASDLDQLEPLFWESGAAWVIRSARRLDRVVKWIERHLEGQKPPELTMRERVWARLPW